MQVSPTFNSIAAPLRYHTIKLSGTTGSLFEAPEISGGLKESRQTRDKVYNVPTMSTHLIAAIILKQVVEFANRFAIRLSYTPGSCGSRLETLRFAPDHHNTLANALAWTGFHLPSLSVTGAPPLRSPYLSAWTSRPQSSYEKIPPWSSLDRYTSQVLDKTSIR